MKVGTDNWAGHDGQNYSGHAILAPTTGQTSQRVKPCVKRWFFFKIKINKPCNASTVPNTMDSKVVSMDQTFWLLWFKINNHSTTFQAWPKDSYSRLAPLPEWSKWDPDREIRAIAAYDQIDISFVCSLRPQSVQ